MAKSKSLTKVFLICALAILSAQLLVGCAGTTSSTSSPAVDNRSASDDRSGGTYLIVIGLNVNKVLKFDAAYQLVGSKDVNFQLVDINPTGAMIMADRDNKTSWSTNKTLYSTKFDDAAYDRGFRITRLTPKINEDDFGSSDYKENQRSARSNARISASGKDVITLGTEGGQQVIYKMKVDGSARKKINFATDDDDEAYVRLGKPSPDLSRFPVHVPDNEFLYSIAGRKLRRIAVRDDLDRLAWTSDSSGFYGVIKKGFYPYEKFSIAFFDANAKLSRTIYTGAPDPGSISLSPDGKTLVFSRWEGEFSNISALPANGGKIVNLTNEDSRRKNIKPVWSPDGKKIAFISIKNDKAALWVMNFDGGDKKRLYNINGRWTNNDGSLYWVKPSSLKKQ